jgi:hypothetical protein
MGVIEEGGLLDNFIEEIMNNPSLVITSALVWGPPPWRPYSFTKKKDLPGMRALTNFLTTSPQNWNSCISSFSEKRKLCRRESRSVQDCIAKNRKIFAAVSSINVFLHCAEI